MSKRVAVTGLGVVTSIGIGKEEFFQNLIDAVPGISEITSHDISALRRKRAGQIKNFNPVDFMSPETALKTGRGSQLAIAGARLALQDLKRPDCLSNVAVIMGTTIGQSDEMRQIDEKWIKSGDLAIDDNELARIPHNIGASNLAKEFGFGGANFTIANSCASANYAIGCAYNLIRKGRAKMVIAGGYDPFFITIHQGLSNLFVIAPNIPQPFDKNSEGTILGEGAGVLILEDLETALKRNATIYAEVLSYGLSCSAYDIIGHDPQGEGLASSMIIALKNAGLEPEAIDYINAQAPGIAMYDNFEAKAINRIFGKKSRVLVSSIKSVLGHTLGASCGINAVVSIMALNKNIIPPTMNLKQIDPEINFNVVANQPQKAELNFVMNNGASFGGNNATVIFKKYKNE